MRIKVMKQHQAPRHTAGIAALTVQKSDAKTLQDFLVARFSLTRRAAKAMIDGRNVWVNRRSVWIARFALRTGDTVEVPEQVVKGARQQATGGHSLASARTVSVPEALRRLAMNAAQLRAASRRGSNMRIFLPRRNSASSNAGGTQVVFPLPGGARNTTLRLRANESRIAGMIFSTGNIGGIRN